MIYDNCYERECLRWGFVGDNTNKERKGYLKSDGSAFGINELGDLITKYHTENNFGKNVELIYVMKTDGTAKFALREQSDYYPHAYLSKGENVVAAGTIEAVELTGRLNITNYTGHFKVDKNDLNPIIIKLNQNGFNAFNFVTNF